MGRGGRSVDLQATEPGTEHQGLKHKTQTSHPGGLAGQAIGGGSTIPRKFSVQRRSNPLGATIAGGKSVAGQETPVRAFSHEPVTLPTPSSNGVKASRPTTSFRIT